MKAGETYAVITGLFLCHFKANIPIKIFILASFRSSSYFKSYILFSVIVSNETIESLNGFYLTGAYPYCGYWSHPLIQHEPFDACNHELTMGIAKKPVDSRLVNCDPC